MDFSWNYQDVMRRLATEEPYDINGSDIDAREALAYAAMLKFDIKGEGCEIPTALISKVTSYIFISAALVHYAPSEQRLVIDGYKIHLHPNVFTDDTKIVNKSLAKKGVAYYLTYSVNQWRRPDLKYKVEIDDCSQFIMRAHRPNVNHCSSADFNKVLRDNIDEVLRQIADDNRRNF